MIVLDVRPYLRKIQLKTSSLSFQNYRINTLWIYQLISTHDHMALRRTVSVNFSV